MATQKKRKKGNPAAFSADYRRGTENPVQDRDDTELDDFLPEGETLPAGDEALEKHGAPRPEPEEPEAPAAAPLPRTARRRGRRRYGIALGAAVLLLALVGVVSLAGLLGSQIYRRATDDSALRAYDAQLACIVMLDPEPFESIESADPLFVQNAALWKSILEKRAEWTGYDDNGLAVIPLGVVAASAQELFGPDCMLSPSNPSEETFYTYDTVGNAYHVSVFSADSALTPYTLSSRKENGDTVLTVGYVLPTDPWRTEEGSSGTPDEPSPQKVMEYVMKTNPETGAEYVSAIREPAS